MFHAAAFGLNDLPFSPNAGAKLVYGPARKLSNAFVCGNLFTPDGLASKGVTVDVDAGYVLFDSIFIDRSSSIVYVQILRVFG